MVANPQDLEKLQAEVDGLHEKRRRALETAKRNARMVHKLKARVKELEEKEWRLEGLER